MSHPEPDGARRAPLSRRLAVLLCGFVLLGSGIALVLQADLGAAPWDVLHQGIARHTPLSIGTATMLVGILVFAVWIPLGERPGIGTVLNVALVGPIVDAGLALVPDANGLVLRSAYLAVGTVLFGTGIGLYISAGLGPGPRDGVMTGLARRGIAVRWVRTVIEAVALGLGWALGGTVGIGTVVVAGGVGHVIQPVLHLAGATTGTGGNEVRGQSGARHAGPYTAAATDLEPVPSLTGGAGPTGRQRSVASWTRCSSSSETSRSR